MAAARIPVFLRGDRNYVQATQMLARTAEHIEQEWGPSFTLKNCSFKKITSNQVDVAFLAGEVPASTHAIGSAIFASSKHAITAEFLETKELADRMALPEQSTVGPALTPESNSFPFAGAHTFEGKLAVIVQALKRFHSGLAQDADELWFTGLRGAAIDIGSGFTEPTGQIRIELLRILGATPRFQTLSMVHVTAAGSPITPFPCTFALRSEFPIHVN